MEEVCVSTCNAIETVTISPRDKLRGSINECSLPDLTAWYRPQTIVRRSGLTARMKWNHAAIRSGIKRRNHGEIFRDPLKLHSVQAEKAPRLMYSASGSTPPTLNLVNQQNQRQTARGFRHFCPDNPLN